MSNQSQNEFNESSLNLQTFILFLLATLGGLFIATLLLPIFLPNMAFSLSGEAPKAYWYLSRGTAFISLSLLWLSMALGLGITNKMARLWPGGPVAYDLHEYTSILGLFFALFHALILIGDAYINYSLFQVLVPFASVNYHQFWVGIGQIGFYLWLLLVLSFYVRNRIGTRSWRLIHYVSYAAMLMALLHGIASGTDSSAAWVVWMYWIAGGSLLFLTVYRVFIKLKLPVVGQKAT